MVSLSVLIRGSVSLEMFWMWPAMNLSLEFSLLTAPRDCVTDGDLVEACWARLLSACILQEEVGSRELEKCYLLKYIS